MLAHREIQGSFGGLDREYLPRRFLVLTVGGERRRSAVDATDKVHSSLEIVFGITSGSLLPRSGVTPLGPWSCFPPILVPASASAMRSSARLRFSFGVLLGVEGCHVFLELYHGTTF